MVLLIQTERLIPSDDYIKRDTYYVMRVFGSVSGCRYFEDTREVRAIEYIQYRWSP